MQIINIEQYPLHDTDALTSVIGTCRTALADEGMFNLANFLTPQAVRKSIAVVAPIMATDSFTHQRKHNVYFKRNVEGVSDNHPAKRLLQTTNHTVCGDQLGTSVLTTLYNDPAFISFLGAVTGKDRLYTMADPLACINVMAYRHGEALNWHFDRSEFTITLLLQAPEQGGVFECRPALRTDDDPNYDGLTRVLDGEDNEVQTVDLEAGTLSVFKGRNTLHRVTPTIGDTERIIAVLSYYETPGVMFSAEERIGFFGRDQVRDCTHSQ